MKQVSEEVIYTEGSIVSVGHQDIEVLIKKSEVTRRKRMRLCTHKNTEDDLHEMFIVHPLGAYVRPHKHLNRAESLHVVSGSADLVVFDDEGNVTGVVKMGDYASGKRFYHRTSGPFYHTLLIKSDVLVFHESTIGPFRKSDSISAPWSPNESDGRGATEFMRRLENEVNLFLGSPDKLIDFDAKYRET